MTIAVNATKATTQPRPSEPADGIDPSQSDADRDTLGDMPEAARRALAEAEVRRAELDAWAASREAEDGGRGGQDPVRYGDWEVKGLACDF